MDKMPVRVVITEPADETGGGITEDEAKVNLPEEKKTTEILNGLAIARQNAAVPRRYEFQRPSTTSSSLLLGAELSPGVMAPPKLNTVKKSRLLVNPGKSMVEWMKIQQQLATKAGPIRPKKIGLDELAQHNTLGDVWTAINDKVFDVSDYIHYHPGGVEELMKGAGQDATTLFNQIHRWVNFESILKGNFLGFLVNEPTLGLVRNKNQSKVALPAQQHVPSTTFSEDDDCIFFEIESPLNEDIRQESWTIGLLNREKLILKVLVKPPKVWTTHLSLLKALTDDHINVHYKNNFKRVLITLRKPQQEQWKALAAPKWTLANNQIIDSRSAGEDMYSAEMFRKQKLTHNVYLFTAVIQTAIIGVPIGCHLQISLHGTFRQYTPVVLSITDEKDLDSAPSSNSQQTAQCVQELHFIIKIYTDGQFTSLLNEKCDSSDSVPIKLGSLGGNFDTVFLHGVETLCLLAGGTGITPFIRILQYLHQRIKSLPIQQVLLIFFNETTQDIIWKEEFTELETKAAWFYFYPVITKVGASDKWNGLQGRISPQLLEDCVRDCVKKKHSQLNSSSSSSSLNNSKALICGSYGFNAACKSALREQTILKLDDPEGIHVFSG